MPAGAFYYTVTLPNISVNGRESEEEIAKQIEKSIKRRGIVLEDPDIVYSMSNNFRFVPVKRSSKEGKLYAPGGKKKAYTAEEFKDIESTLQEQVNKLACNVFGGNMDILPLEIENKTTEPCKYCALGDFCRNKKQEDEDDIEQHADE